jgi:hypothetical protein
MSVYITEDSEFDFRGKLVGSTLRILLPIKIRVGEALARVLASDGFPSFESVEIRYRGHELKTNDYLIAHCRPKGIGEFALRTARKYRVMCPEKGIDRVETLNDDLSIAEYENQLRNTFNDVRYAIIGNGSLSIFADAE